MHLSTALSLATLLFPSASMAQDPAPAAPAPAPRIVEAREARDAAGLDAAIVELLRAHPDRLAARTLARSAGDRPIPLLTVGTDPANAARRPAIVVVAGMDGHRWSSTEAALGIVETLLRDRPEGLNDVLVHVVPRANPDPAEAFARAVRRAYSGNAVPHDNDKDGAGEEDPPRDLDGNGVITQMRKAGDFPPWSTPSMATDPAEPRLMRSPDAATGQVPEWTVWTEGIDADGDGRMAEDWAGGIDPERNFPHRWAEFEDEAGVYPLLAPESKAIADFVIANPGIFAAVVIGRHDTVVSLPDGKAKTTHGMPVMIAEQDAAAYHALAKDLRERLGLSRAEGADTAGSLVAWLNAQRGMPAFATTLWGRPDVPPPPEGTAVREGTPANTEEAAWLDYSDRVRGGRGFVPWTRHPHPQLFEVEVGGWVPGFRENPPVDEVMALAERCAGFLPELAARRARVALRTPTVTAVGPGLWRIDTAITNTGRLPTVMQGGRAAGVVPAHVVRVSVPVTRIKAGRRMDVVRGIDPGALRPVSWIVQAEPGEEVTVELLFAGQPEQRFSFRDGEPIVETSAEAAR
ncbi:MAG: hypothetical protein RI990_151 [Planctomycetota bacterium]